jgi:hypothetical protein
MVSVRNRAKRLAADACFFAADLLWDTGLWLDSSRASLAGYMNRELDLLYQRKKARVR